MIAYTQRDTLGREVAISNLRLDLKGAEHFPEWVFSLPNLQELHLFNAQFGQLHFADWPWPKLEKLKLIRCGLQSFSFSASDVIALTVLDLSENSGLAWPGHFLGQAAHLQALHFSKNGLSGAKLPGLEYLSRLRSLYLDDNLLSSVPPTVFQLRLLRILDVSSNRISSIPAGIGQLEQLDQFAANNNRLKNLPDNFGELAMLSHLQLNQNGLSALPESMRACLMLRKLELRKNKFTHFPDFLDQLPWLSELDLANNKLNVLPKQTATFSQLSKLDLSYNQLAFFSLASARLPKLRELKLVRNQLTDLPALPDSLLSLNASGNALSRIPAALLKLPDLKDLYLERNRIDQLPDNFGKLQSSLIRLGMLGNPVRTAPEALLNLRQLKELSGLLSAARQKDLVLAAQTARLLDLSDELLRPFYDLLRSDRTVLPTLAPPAIRLALNHPVSEVVARVRQFVQQQYGLPARGNLLKKGSTLGIVGRTFFDKPQLEQRLHALGIELRADYDPEQCTHLLLGFPVITQEIPPAKQAILNEKQLARRLDQLEKKPLLKERSETRLRRLQQLLTSPDTTNIQLGFRMIKGNGLPPTLWNELLVAYYLCERDPALQLQIKSFIRLRLEDEGKNKFFAALTPQLIKWGKIKPEKEQLLRRNRFDLGLVQGYLR